MNDTVLHVGGASPYDVVVGRGLAEQLPAVTACSASPCCTPRS